MFPWVILQLWSVAWVFSVLFGAKTHRTSVSVFVLLHCQNSSAGVFAEARYEGFEHTHTLTHTLTCIRIKSVCLFLKHIHMQTHTVHLPFPFSNTHRQNTHTQKHRLMQPPLVIYSLCCVRVCWLTCLSLNALILLCVYMPASVCVCTCLDSHLYIWECISESFLVSNK